MKGLVKDAKALTGGVLGGLILSSLRSLILLRVLGPDLIGPWRSAMLVHSLGEFARLGAIRGAGLRIPVLLGRGEAEEAAAVERAGGVFAWRVGIVLGLLTFLISCLVHDANTRLALRFIAVIITTAQPGYLLAEVAAARHAFRLRAWESLLENGVNLGGALVLAPLFGLYGLGASSILASLFGLAFFWRGLRFRFTWSGDWWRTRQLIGAGLPFALSEGGFELLRRLDILVMTFLLGPLAVGYYGISLLIMDFSLLFARNGVSQVLSPHLLREFGRGGAQDGIAAYYQLPARLFSYLTPPLLGLGAFALPLLVPVLLPQYSPGIRAAQVTLWSLMFVALHASMSSYFVAAGMIPSVLKLFAYVAPLGAVLQCAVMKLGFGLTGAAWATFCTLGLAACGEVALGQRSLRESYARSALYIATLIAPLAAAVTSFYAVDRWIPPESYGIWALPVRVMAFLLLYSPVLVFCENRFSLLRMVREAN